jgi:MoaA/NifB/PqqE/SkfB family radical SAM enzyme
MARVLLVNPPIYDFAAFDLWAKPLGLLYVAAALEKEGHEVRVIDCLDRFHPSVALARGKNAPKRRRYGTGSYYWRAAERPACYGDIPRIYKRFGLPEETIRAELADGPAPDVVGVTSGMTYWYPGVAEIVTTVREVFPEAPVVLGGIYATLCGEHARETVRPDYLVAGPGEAAMARIVGEVVGGGSRREPAPEDSASVAELPFAAMPNPAYHLLRHFESVSVLTGRGCPFRCAYCASGILSPRIERREPAAVVDEIEGYKRRFGIEDVAFYDDALLWDAERHAKPMLREIVRRNLGLRFHTPNGLHAKMLDEELAALMKRSGFKTIRLSLETVEPGRQGDWDDKVSYDDFLEAAARLKEAGFAAGEIGAYVMTGLPGETVEEAARSIAAAHAAGVEVRLAHYSPIPGTAYFERARREARADISEPLLQNNTVVSAGGIGGYEDYARLKGVARALNDSLAAGRVVFAAGEVRSGFAAAMAGAGFEL